MSNELQELNSKIDVLTKMIAVTLSKDLEQAEAIRLLSKSGMSPKAIAELLDITANAVSIAIHRIKKNETKKKSKK